ncbi:MAG: hypothetical protein ACLFWM_02435 [Actinomycetota bacterium]
MAFRLTLTGVGAMNSPRFKPAGLLVDYDGRKVMLDGGSSSPVPGGLAAWLVTDERAELIREVKDRAAEAGLEAAMGSFTSGGLSVEARPVVHTTRPTVAYRIEAEGCRIVWAPEFYEFPEWIEDEDLLFADAAGWDRPIHFTGKIGGHAPALAVAREARTRGVKRLILAHIGRPTIRAMDRGERPPFGQFGRDGMVFEPRRWRT